MTTNGRWFADLTRLRDRGRQQCRLCDSRLGLLLDLAGVQRRSGRGGWFRHFSVGTDGWNDSVTVLHDFETPEINCRSQPISHSEIPSYPPGWVAIQPRIIYRSHFHPHCLPFYLRMKEKYGHRVKNTTGRGPVTIMGMVGVERNLADQDHSLTSAKP